jgi:hypothetical protein
LLRDVFVRIRNSRVDSTEDDLTDGVGDKTEDEAIIQSN